MTLVESSAPEENRSKQLYSLLKKGTVGSNWVEESY